VYVWVLRDKGSEWRTIKKFLRRGRLPFAPLVEAVCEPYLRKGSQPNPVEVIDGLSHRLSRLTDCDRVWVDLGNLLFLFSPGDVARLHSVVRRHLGLRSRVITPSVRTSSPPQIVRAAIEWARSEECGLCIRVDGLTHLPEKALVVNQIVADSGLTPADIDLILDAQDLPRAVSHEEMRRIVPLVSTCRTWVVAAGTFPKISDLEHGIYEHLLDRGEFSAWREEIETHHSGRLPLFGDYATQPSVYAPSPPFPGSPSVRYTVADGFIVLRGRGGESGDIAQYKGHARYLRQTSYYRGVIDTPGDDYVDHIAGAHSGTGNQTTWRIASFERHVHVVNAQVAEVMATVEAR